MKRNGKPLNPCAAPPPPPGVQKIISTLKSQPAGVLRSTRELAKLAGVKYKYLLAHQNDPALRDYRTSFLDVMERAAAEGIPIVCGNNWDDPAATPATVVVVRGRK